MVGATVAKTILSICKSFVFNCLVFVIGFGFGYLMISTEVHDNATKHNSYDRTRKIDESVVQLRDIADFIERENNIFKHQIAHENHVSNSWISCGSEFGKKIWK